MPSAYSRQDMWSHQIHTNESSIYTDFSCTVHGHGRPDRRPPNAAANHSDGSAQIIDVYGCLGLGNPQTPASRNVGFSTFNVIGVTPVPPTNR